MVRWTRGRGWAGPWLAGALLTGVALAGCGGTPSVPAAVTTPDGSTAAPPSSTTGPQLSSRAPQSSSDPATNDPAANAPAPGTPSVVLVPVPRNLVDAGYRGRYRASGMVLQARGHGPHLCLGTILDSLPPKCGGPDIVGWSWTGLAHEDQIGTQWGSFTLVGRYDGTRFSLTEPATIPRPAGPGSTPFQDLTSPCPEPAGGWTPVHPATATDAALNAANDLAGKQKGFGMLWVDQHFPPGESPGPSTESPNPKAIPNDPARIILNITTTGDRAAMERAVRAVWGGNLCVSKALRTDAELRRVQEAVVATPGALQAGVNGFTGQVEVTVIRATVQQQAAFDARYGAGVVRLTGVLQPID